MEKKDELDLDQLLALSKTDTTKCISLLIDEVKRLRGEISSNQSQFNQEILKRDQKVTALTHKLEKYNKIFTSFSTVLTNNGFGASGHGAKARGSLKFEPSKEYHKQESEIRSEEFHSFDGDHSDEEDDQKVIPEEAQESIEEVKQEAEEENKFGRDLTQYM